MRSCLMQTKRRDVGRKTHHFLRSSRAGATAAEQRSAVAERQLCCRSKRALLRCAERFHGCIYREKYSGFPRNTALVYCAREWCAAVGNKANMLATSIHIILIFNIIFLNYLRHIILISLSFSRGCKTCELDMLIHFSSVSLLWKRRCI